MTKKQALAEFREFILPAVIKQYGRFDRVAKSESWCNYTDSLRAEGRITAHQDSTWVNPY
jgi:hypothetical protein